MKILVVSDTHMFNEYFEDLLNTYSNDVDLLIHCGDSSLRNDSYLLKNFDVVVKGNHDEENFPNEYIYNNIFITHGHLYQVYSGYENLINACKKNNCKICLHGHTHVPTLQVLDNILFVNPGSLMINRGSYGYGTYALITIEQNIDVQFYHHQTHKPVPSEILDEGLELLEEFKKYAKK